MQAIYQTIIYQTVVTKIGQFARDALAENMLITFIRMLISLALHQSK